MAELNVLRQEKKAFRRILAQLLRVVVVTQILKGREGAGWFLLIPVKYLVALEVLLDKLLSLMVGDDGNYLAK